MGKTASKEASHRVPFNWTKLKKMWDEGKSYLDMAKSLDAHYNADGDDATKSIRAKCSVAMTKGVNIDGKLVRFRRRSKPPVGKEPKPKTTATKPPKKAGTSPGVQKAKKAAPKKPAKDTSPNPSPDKPIQPTEA
jgi:hypothetical protein